MKKSVDGMMAELNSMQQVLVNKSISIFDENFNTGKTVKDTIIKCVVVTTATAAVYNLTVMLTNQVGSCNWQYFVDKMLYVIGMKVNRIAIKNITPGIGMNGPTSTKRFQAVLHQIMKLGYGNSGVYTLLENPNQELIPFMSGTDFLITFKPGVYGRIQYEKVERPEMCVPMTAEIFSKSYSLVQLQQLLGCWIEEYEKFEKESGWNDLKFFGTVSGNDKRGSPQFNYSDRIFAILHQIEKRALFNPKLDIPCTINTQRNILPFWTD